MQQLLASKLHAYIAENNPDLLLHLQDEQEVSVYLKSKVESVLPVMENLLAGQCPSYIIIDICMQQLTEDLLPSKYHYITSLLEEEFEEKYNKLVESGTLTYEVTYLISLCDPVFEKFQFSVLNENDRRLHYSITAVISSYFEEDEKGGGGGL